MPLKGKNGLIIIVIAGIMIAVAAIIFIKKPGTPEQKRPQPVIPTLKTSGVQREAPAAVSPATELAPKEDLVLYDFESTLDGWEIPEWALEKEDHVTRSIDRSQDFAKTGSSSMKLMTEFPGTQWTAAFIEAEKFFYWGPYGRITAAIYLPQDAPKGLKARFVLTVGKDWKFTEMNRAIYLNPGEWNILSATLTPGSEDWQMTVVDDNFRKDVRKVAVRIESNKKPAYSGPVYIDDIRLSYK